MLSEHWILDAPVLVILTPKSYIFAVAYVKYWDTCGPLPSSEQPASLELNVGSIHLINARAPLTFVENKPSYFCDACHVLHLKVHK